MLLEGKVSTSHFLSSGRSASSNDTDYGKLPDKLLWEAFKKGNELAFTKIYKDYANVRYNHGCQFSSDREMVKDCLQDFFIYLRKNRADVQGMQSSPEILQKSFKSIQALRAKQPIFVSAIL